MKITGNQDAAHRPLVTPRDNAHVRQNLCNCFRQSGTRFELDYNDISALIYGSNVDTTGVCLVFSPLINNPQPRLKLLITKT